VLGEAFDLGNNGSRIAGGNGKLLALGMLGVLSSCAWNAWCAFSEEEVRRDGSNRVFNLSSEKKPLSLESSCLQEVFFQPQQQQRLRRPAKKKDHTHTIVPLSLLLGKRA